MDNVLQDIRYGFRTFSRRRGITALAVLTLALGIGASTAMFSVVDTVMWRVLPYPDPERLVEVFPTFPSIEGHATLGDFALRGIFAEPEF